jgi:hypothetical protein
VKVINQKIRTAIENEGRLARIEGLWWQFSLTERSSREPSAVSILRISRDRGGALEISGRGWQEDGTLSSRYWSEASREKKDPSGIFYFFKAERPRHPGAPQFQGREKSASNRSIAPPGTGPRTQTVLRKTAYAHPASIYAPIRATWRSSTDATIENGRS